MTTAEIDPEAVETFRAVAGRGDLNTVKTLLEKSEDPFVASAYMLCAAAYSGHLDIVNLLISRGVDVNASEDDTALLSAVQGGQTKVVRLLIDAGADVRARSLVGDSALHQAVTTCHVSQTGAIFEVIDQLLEEGLHIGIEDDNGRTPLHEAAFNGRVELLNGLLARGAKLDAKDRWQDTPLDRACLNGHLEVVKFLICRGAEVNASSGGCEGLGRAARIGHLHLVTLLLDNRAKPLPAGNKGPELLYAAGSGVPEAVQLLMDRGYSFQGPRSLLRAVVLNSVGAVIQILDHGVDLKVKNKKQQNLLHLAVLSKRIERQTPSGVSNSRNKVIKLLVEKGVDGNAMDTSGKTAFDIAVELGYPDAADILVGQKWYSREGSKPEK
ncbi:MAG: hypothetical protein L6R35_006115 [Caloplaca aegaea]|nr:MAG: hypothetical protein L6R35_006115 [Caloplaca aegaea]